MLLSCYIVQYNDAASMAQHAKMGATRLIYHGPALTTVYASTLFSFWHCPCKTPEASHAGAQVNPLTAYGLLDAVGPLPEGAWLAQSAAGSVLGRQVIALAAHRGIRTVNLVRRAAQRQELLSLGCAPLPMPAAPYSE